MLKNWTLHLFILQQPNKEAYILSTHEQVILEEYMSQDNESASQDKISEQCTLVKAHS